MSDRKLSAQEWSNLYGWEHAASARRFWLIVGTALVLGVVLGAYFFPRSFNAETLAPNEVSIDKEELHNLRDKAIKFEQRELLEESMQLSMKTVIEEELTEQDEKIETLDFPALLFTLRRTDEQICTDYVIFSTGVGNQILPMEPYDC